MPEQKRSSRNDRRRSRSPDDSRHSYHDDREKRPRDDSRGPSDRERTAAREHDRGGEGSRTQRVDQEKDREAVSQTIIIKGLSAHTTVPADTGDCKGFAFVLFPSVEHAQFFMIAFAGSSGDPNAPQFIVGNRAVTLGYARDDKFDKGEKDREPDRDSHYGNGGNGNGNGGGGSRGGGHRRDDDRERDKDRDKEKDSKHRNDWLCDMCQGHNFARRAACYRCSAPRGENVTLVGTNGSISHPDVFTDGAVGCDFPSTFLAVRGFGPFVTEDSVIELFRQFAVVKSVKILRDQITGISKGLAYVEFHTIEHAVHTFKQTSVGPVYLDSNPLKICYAKESFRIGILSSAAKDMQSHLIPPSSSMARTLSESVQTPGYLGSSFNNVQPPSVQTNSKAPVQVPSKIKPLWPPSFDTDGGAYIFQPQSGSFLEPKSQFFYCPKSKLYYSCTDGIYYNCVVVNSNSSEISFTRFNPPLPLEPEGTISSDLNTKTVTGTTPVILDTANLLRKPVILSIGFGMKNKNAISKVTITNKKISGDMLKWGSIQDEENDKEKEEKDKKMSNMIGSKGKGKSSNILISNSIIPIEPILIMKNDKEIIQVPSSSSSSALPIVTNDSNNNSNNNNSSNNNNNNNNSNNNSIGSKALSGIQASHTTPQQHQSPPITTKTQTQSQQQVELPSNTPELVACLLCRRQFATPEQLLRHERESKLHKENMIVAATLASDNISKQLAAFATATAGLNSNSTISSSSKSNPPLPLPLPVNAGSTVPVNSDTGSRTGNGSSSVTVKDASTTNYTSTASTTSYSTTATTTATATTELSNEYPPAGTGTGTGTGPRLVPFVPSKSPRSSSGSSLPHPPPPPSSFTFPSFPPVPIFSVPPPPYFQPPPTFDPNSLNNSRSNSDMERFIDYDTNTRNNIGNNIKNNNNDNNYENNCESNSSGEYRDRATERREINNQSTQLQPRYRDSNRDSNREGSRGVEEDRRKGNNQYSENNSLFNSTTNSTSTNTRRNDYNDNETFGKNNYGNNDNNYRDNDSKRKNYHFNEDQGSNNYNNDDNYYQNDDSDNYSSNNNNNNNNSGNIVNYSSTALPLDDQSNPGSQMLRKMGWSAGQGLGRSNLGTEESVGVKLAENSNINNSDNANSNYGGSRRVTGVGGDGNDANGYGSIPRVDYRGSGRDYKDSLMRAAKARYDQVSNSNVNNQQ